MKTQMEAQIIEEGAITLPARRFFQLIREIPLPQIELSCAWDDIAHIQAGTSEFRLHGINKGEFPAFPDLTYAEHFTLSGPILKEMFTKSAFAAAKEDSRHILNGVFMQIEGGEAIFTGTDGKRLAKIQTPIAISEGHAGGYLIPIKAVEEIIKLIEDDEEVKVSLTHDKIALESGSTILLTKLLSGEYPQVDRIIPEKVEKRFILHREELMSLLKQVSLFTTEKSHSIHFLFTPGELTLQANASEIGEGKVSMPVDYSGETFEAAYNPLFFHDILRHCRDETVTFSTTTPHNPGLITDSSTAKFVIMPMRLCG